MAGDDDLRCSVITAALGEQPAGSAGGADRYLLVELPLPWPKKIDGHPLLAEVTVTGNSVTPNSGTPTSESEPSSTILGIRSNDSIELSSHRIICYERTVPFRGFERCEFLIARDELASTVSALLSGGATNVDSTHQVPMVEGTEDLLLCTHGTRDRCCGRLGTLLHLELDCALPEHVRMWRTSHTGGHRFAPTGIHFPSGTAWSSLTAELTIDIVNQTIATNRLGRHFRGNVGVTGRPAQIAEGQRFLESGWNWLEQQRTTTSRRLDERGSVTYEATVESGGEAVRFLMVEDDALPVPICGEGTEHSVKSTPQLRVTSRSDR